MKKILSILIVTVMIVSLLPCAFAESSVQKVSLRIYPDSSYAYDNNQSPIVGEDASYIYALVSAGEATLDTYYLMDGGSQATGKVQNHSYTFYARVTASSGYVFDSSTGASVNNDVASISISNGGTTAEITCSVKPRAVEPTVYHNPESETHNIGETFSFVASAGNYDSFQWYLESPYGVVYKAEDIGKIGLSGTVTDLGTSVRWNISSVPENLNEWFVYCGFTGEGGYAQTARAYINVNGAQPNVVSPYVTSTPSVSSSQYISNGIYVVETPTPSAEIWVVETPTPEVTATPAPTDTVASTPLPEESEDDEKTMSKGLKTALIAVGGVAVLGGGLLATQYAKDKKKRDSRVKESNLNYKGKH